MRRALVVARPGSISIEARPLLKPGPGEVVARPRLVGVCATDLELLRGQVDPTFVRYPLVLGHEWSGMVEAVGPGVTSVAPGEAIVSEGIVPCGTCTRCAAGRTHLCATYDEVGFTRDGAASDQVLVPAEMVHRLDPSVELLDAVMAEPAAVVAQALGRLGPARPGGLGTVLVIGAGSIALLSVMLVRSLEPTDVFVLGRRPIQGPLAERAGADRFATAEVDPRVSFGQPDGFDLVIEAAGSVDSVAMAFHSVRRGGTILLLGLPPAGSSVTIQPDNLVNNDLTIIASFASTAPAWERVVDLLDRGEFRPGSLVTHRFPLEDHAAAFAALEARTIPTGKVILEI